MHVWWILSLAPLLSLGGAKKKIIIDGEIVPIEEVPYMAAILYKDEFIAAGTIISLNRVATTATAIRDKKFEDLVIRVGHANYTQGQSFKVKDITVPPLWTPEEPLLWDYAQITLDTNLEISRQIRPIDTINPRGNTIKPNVEGTIIGWGGDLNGPLSTVLRRTTVHVMQWHMCALLYYAMIRKEMMCAGERTHNACLGDHGSPLIVNETVLVGIVSQGLDCVGIKDNDFPTILTDLSTLKNFPNQTLEMD